MHKKKNSRDDNLWGENNKKLFLIVIYFLWLKKHLNLNQVPLYEIITLMSLTCVCPESFLWVCMCVKYI